MMFFRRKFCQKIASFVALWAVCFSIGVPIVQAKSLFDFSESQQQIKNKSPEISREKIVAILVQKELLDTSLQGKIEQYANDVQNEINSQVIIIPIPKDASPLEIQEGLAQLYFSGYKNDHKSQLVGVVLIGEVPLPIVDKNGGLNPAIFPYVDFEDTVYTWDYAKERFVWRGGDDEPEIWHGVIRSDAESLEAQIQELTKFFTRNHEVHQNRVNYPKKVFFADFYRQRQGINDKQKKFYENWINHLGDFVYLRFSKHWLKQLLDEEMAEGGVPSELLPADMQGQNQSVDLSEMPDIFTKNAIETMSMRYLTANKNLLSQINEQVEQAGRWEAVDIDTTISLIAKKDQWAADILKKATDEVENILIQKSRENNIKIAADISIISNTGNIYPGGNTSLPSLRYFSPYWLGVNKNSLKEWNWRTGDTNNPPEFPAENCSLYRGTIRDNSNSLAQKVEISRVFNPYLYDSDPDDYCMGKIVGNDVSFADCRMSKYISDMSNTDPEEWDEVNTSVFKFTGSRETFDVNYDGASGCAPIIKELQSSDIKAEVSVGEVFSSLMVHNEPTLDTIKAMVKNSTARDIPIDPHHGISFYDHAYNFHRIYFPSAFDLINKRDEQDENFSTLTKAELEQNLLSVINQINSTAGNAGKIQESFFADSTWMNPDKQKELIEAIKWLGTDLERKNIEVLVGALSTSGKARNILKQPDFAGYELTEIRGELAKIKNEEGLKIAFERGEEKPSSSFVEAKNSSEGGNPLSQEIKSQVNSRENFKLQQEFEKIFAESAENNSSCTGNILTWPATCLIPWLQSLPNVFQKITKLVPKIDLEKIENVLNTTESSENPAKNSASFSLIPTELPDDISLNKISVEPSSFKISTNDSFPLEINLKLQDDRGNILLNDYETEIELISSDSNLETFFQVLPAKKVLAKAGQAKFFLIPQKQDFGGQVKLKFRGKNIESPELKIDIVNYQLAVSAESDEVKAGDDQGVQISAKILNSAGEIAHDFDGKVLTFSAKQGSFVNDELTGKRAKINNGVAEITFFPGIKAGEVEIKVQDQEKLLPETSLFLQVVPTNPAKVDFLQTPEKLVANGDFTDFFAGIFDKYGNLIPDLADKIQWQVGENLFLKKSEQAGKVFIKYQEQPKEKTFLKKITEVFSKKNSQKKNNILKEKITLKADLDLPDNKENEPLVVTKSREILITKNPIFETIIPEKNLQAGDTEPLKIKILAKTEQGKVLKNNFSAQVLVDNKNILTTSPVISFENGEAEVEIFAGKKSGTANLQIKAPGFLTNTFSIQVNPAEPYQIKLLAKNTVLNADDSTPLTLKVQVLDKYGNLAKFNDKINFVVNPPEDLTDSAEEIKNLGLFSNPATADSFVQNQTNNSTNVVLPVSLEQTEITLQNGMGENKISPVDLGGKAYILAKSANLLPGTITVDVVKILTASDFKHLSPKSLLTLLLGFAGGKLTEKNLGNRFLFDGQTQAVATQIMDKNQLKNLGNIFADEKISRDLKVQVLNKQNFTLDLNNLVNLELHLSDTPQIFLGKQTREETGFYFQPSSELAITDFALKSREISYQGQPLFQITKKGGVILKNSQLEFKNIENSLKEWQIILAGKVLGNLFVKTDNASVITEEESRNFAGNYWLAKPLSDEIEISKTLNGKTTTEPRGLGIFSKTEKESNNRLLGSSNFPTNNEKLGWTTFWKAGTLLAAENSIGDSAKFSAGENFILLGDPSLSVKKENPRSELGLTKDLGEPIWRTALGTIDDIAVGDLNFDDHGEIFIRRGNTLYGLYQDPHNQDNFRDIGKILRFADGAQKVVSYNKDNGDLVYLIQLNKKGKLVFHHNKNGKFSREKIDLGLNDKVLKKLAVAHLNSDKFADLVLLDDSNNIYFVYGREGGFYSAQLLDNVGGSFVPIDENYTISDGQDLGQKYINPEKFKYLQNFFAGFSGITDYAWTLNWKKVGDTDFLPVTENKAFNIHLQVTQDNPQNLPDYNLKVQKDSEFSAKLTIYSPNTTDLNNFKIIIPKFAGLEREENTLDITNCQGTPEIKEQDESFMITGCNFSKQKLIRISWKLKARKIPLINFKIADFVGKDGIDDIFIPWKENGKKKFIQYRSHGNLKMYPPNPAKKTPDSPSSPITKTHLKKIVAAFADGSTFPTDFDAESSAQDIFNCLKGNGEELPPFYQTPSVEEEIQVNSVKKNFAGLQIPSYAFLAPGSQSIYIPPIAFPGPQSPGFPVLWVGPSPPFVGAGPNPASLFRLYVMPTTTLRVGIGICGGPVLDSLMSPSGIPFPPQCFVIVPPLFSSSSSGGDGNGNGNSGSNNSNNCAFQNPANSLPESEKSKQDFLLNSFAESKNSSTGSFSFVVGGGDAPNLDIAAPDIITEWAKAQMEEFSNYKFPQFDIVLPKFPKLGFGDKSMKPLDRLSASPYFEIKREKIDINYPKISREKLQKLKANFKIWKKGNLSLKQELKQSLISLDTGDFADFDLAVEDYRQKFNAGLSVNVNLPDLSKLPPELQVSIKGEFQNFKTRSAELKSLVNSKLDALKQTPEVLVNSAKNKIQEQLDEIEKLETDFESNLEALESYQTEIKKLKVLPQKVKKATKELTKINEIISLYWSTWMSKNEQAVQKWKNFAKKTKAIVQTWNDIPQLFTDFTVSCVPGGGGGASSVNRGTLITWLMKILLSAIKLPVIPMPQMPDTVIDLSSVKIGASLTVPEINFTPVNISLPKLPTSLTLNLNPAKLIEGTLNTSLQSVTTSVGSLGKTTDLAFDSLENITNEADLLVAGKNIESSLKSLNANLNTSYSSSIALEVSPENFAGNFINNFPALKVPPIPKLPPLPKVVPKVELPTINLPQLPTLLPPPNFPNILKPVTTIISVIRPFMKTILCWLSMGIIPIPEWKVASRVVELTNRTKLLPMDFVFSAQLPDFPKLVAPTINIKPKIELVPAFESFNTGVKSLAQTLNSVTAILSSAGKGIDSSLIPQKISRDLPKNNRKSELAYLPPKVSVYNQFADKSGEINTKPVLQKLKKLANSSTIKISLKQEKEKSRLEKKLVIFKNSLASLKDAPDFLPNDFDTTSRSNKNIEPQPIEKLYYFSAKKDLAEVITDFPVEGKTYHLQVADLDQDGKDEILYSIDGQLFMKRLANKKQTPKNTYSVIHQNFADFSKYFAPTLELQTDTNTSKSKLEFLPPKSNDVSYFEWVISDRPDRIFEPTPKSREKFSQVWKRIGFLIRPKPHKYEIRPGVAQIKKVKGSPILYGSKLKNIAKFSSSECNNPQIKKPFFPQETVLVGVAKESQFRVRTKKRQGEQAKERNVVLRAGEETAVDFAEICLTKGEIKYLDPTKIEKFNPQEGDHFFSDMRFELGKNDEVELSLYNDTKVHIYGGEKYELRSFNSRENLIKNIQKLDLGNYYGQFQAFSKEGESFIYSKNLLHDPQLGDDKTPPEIIISQGSKVVAYITAPIEIDASESYDNQKISRVWWERDGKIFLDSKDKKYSITELLKIKLPAKNSPQTFSVTINIEDESGNISSQEIPIEIKVPKLELADVSRRDQEIRGRVVEGIPDLKVGFLRERKGRKDILEKTILSGENGEFILKNLSLEGPISLKNKYSKKKFAEILETGRPIITDEKEAGTFIEKSPFSIKIKNSQLDEVADLAIKTSSENDIEINSFQKEIPAKLAKNSNQVLLVDANHNDNFVWVSSKQGATFLDNENKKTIGFMSNNGVFTTTDYLKKLAIKPKKAENEDSPLIFQIYNDKSLLAEFFIPIKEVIVQ